MNNVVKLRGFDRKESSQFFKINDGYFGKWAFDVEVWDKEPTSLFLERLTPAQTRAYHNGDVNLFHITFTACINDLDILASGGTVWVEGLTVENGFIVGDSLPVTKSYLARTWQKEAIDRSMKWLSGAVGMLNIWDAKEAIDLCRTEP